jgi:hypothetical protein
VRAAAHAPNDSEEPYRVGVARPTPPSDDLGYAPISIERGVWPEETEEETPMFYSLFLVLFIVLFLVWVLGWFAFHIAGGLIHILLIVAVISLIVHFARGRP